MSGRCAGIGKPSAKPGMLVARWRTTVDKSMKNVTVSVTKENYAILEWLAGKDETTVADLLSDAAYNLAQDNLTDYREHEKEHKIASIKAEIESVEAKKNDQSVTAE